MDYDTPGIYHIGADQYGNVRVTNITKNVMQSWIERDDVKITRTSYDDNMDELLFEHTYKNSNGTTKSRSLAYQNGVFTAFYDYIGPVFNYKTHSVNIYDNWLYLMREGCGFDMPNRKDGEDYSVTFIANPSLENGTVASDCIFDNVEFTGDVYDENGVVPDMDNVNIPFYGNQDSTLWYKGFDRIECWNSYQHCGGLDNSPEFIKKFRKWRVPIPRQDNTRARMRDNWIKIKLSSVSDHSNKFVLKNVQVDAFY